MGESGAVTEADARHVGLIGTYLVLSLKLMPSNHLLAKGHSKKASTAVKQHTQAGFNKNTSEACI